MRGGHAPRDLHSVPGCWTGGLNPGENAGEYILAEQPTASPDVNFDPSQAAQPEGWSEPPPQDIAPLQTWVGQP